MPRESVKLQALSHWPISAVLAVQARAYGPALIERAEVLAHKIAASAPPQALSWGAGQGAELRAYAIAVPWRSDWAPQWDQAAAVPLVEADCLYVHDVAVAPEHHGLGLASALLDKVLAQARACGLPRAALVAVQGAEAYWARHGFARHTPAQPLSSFGADAVWMLRAL